METVPREVMTELSSGGAPVATPHLPYKPVYGPVEFAPSLHLEAPLRVRLGLQQRAVTNLHNHVLRAVRRSAGMPLAPPASLSDQARPGKGGLHLAPPSGTLAP